MELIFQSAYIHEIPFPLEKQEERKAIVKECRANFLENDLYNLRRYPLYDEWRVNDMWMIAGVLPISSKDITAADVIISFDYHFYIRGAFMDNRFEIGNRNDLLNLKDVLLTAVTSEFTGRKKVFLSVSKNKFNNNLCL